MHDLAAIQGYYPRRLSSIPANTLSFEKCRVIVRNLPFAVDVCVAADDQMTETRLYNLFSAHVPVHSVLLPRVEAGGASRSRGYGFVQVYCSADVETAVSAVNGVTVMVEAWCDDDG